MTISGSLLANVPERLEAELFEQLLNVANVRIERIVSTGQATPPGEWFDQAWDEWVVVLAGAAQILLETEDTPRSLATGDYLFLPAHLRHRVTWTSPERPTVWLAVHIAVQEGGLAVARLSACARRLGAATPTDRYSDTLLGNSNGLRHARRPR